MKRTLFWKTLPLLSILLLFVSCDDDEQVMEDPQYVSNLAGTFDARARMYFPHNGLDLSYCDQLWWEGTVVLEAVDDPLVDTVSIYKTWSINSLGDLVEDPSMGAYYRCYEATQTNPSHLPNGANGQGTLRLHDDNGALRWWGASVLGDTFYIRSLEIMGNTLQLNFQNSYGEEYEVILTRLDGTNWDENLRPG